MLGQSILALVERAESVFVNNRSLSSWTHNGFGFNTNVAIRGRKWRLLRQKSRKRV